MDTYKIVKRVTATLALVNVALHLFALWLAMADGNQSGFEIPGEIATAWSMFGGVLVLLAVGAWIVEHATEDTARRIIVPAVEAAVREALEAQTPAIARGVAEVVTGGLDMKLQHVANKASDRTVASMRAAITADITEIVEAGLKRAQRYGMTRQATAQANNGKVVHLRDPQGT